ncbi:MAG: hypothetical protein M1829_004580 [Trizodia sp. TS-e1964]|nr:MAG: hypothetical protein M1829_004580 [Trizodia sp. TS-e1964]
MSYGARSLGSLDSSDDQMAMLLPIVTPDGDSYTRSDNASLVPQHSLPIQTSLTQPFSNPFEDQYPKSTITPDPVSSGSAAVEAPSIERDNKLLGFSHPIYNFTLLDYTGRRTSLSLSAQLHGMFFLAESPWASDDNRMGPMTELTCYRRNIFQISGSVTLPRTVRYVLTDAGNHIPFTDPELSISATESIDNKPVKIISVPWKTPASNIVVPEDKTGKDPVTIPLDLMADDDLDSEYATFPISWKRLQFRVSTANNGRRKELQQHFVVRLKIRATLSDGTKVELCEAKSGAIIVRGRSPRNFQSRKDLPLPGGAPNRKGHHHHPVLSRTASIGSRPLKPTESPLPSPDIAQIPNHYQPTEIDLPPNMLDWIKIEPAHMSSLRVLSGLESPSFSPLPYSKGAPELSFDAQYAGYPLDQDLTPPAVLSLTDESLENPLSLISSNTTVPRKAPRILSQKAFPARHISERKASHLYEYFPLGLDDWMPPVEAVYMPHDFHHNSMASEFRGLRRNIEASNSAI